MNGIEYYKSLISDEEVIKALVKESKAREGLFKEKARLRPNLTFFQRTVTNLVTSNRRAGTTKELKYEEEVSIKTLNKNHGKVKPPRTLIKEIVESNKVKNSAQIPVIELDSDSDEELNRTECCESEDLVRNKKRKLVHETNNKIKPSKSIKVTKSTKCEIIDPIEESEREDLNKYFVRAKEGDKKWVRNPNKAKSKSIVFNLNIKKDKLG